MWSESQVSVQQTTEKQEEKTKAIKADSLLTILRTFRRQTSNPGASQSERLETLEPEVETEAGGIGCELARGLLAAKMEEVPGEDNSQRKETTDSITTNRETNSLTIHYSLARTESHTDLNHTIKPCIGCSSESRENERNSPSDHGLYIALDPKIRTQIPSFLAMDALVNEDKYSIAIE